VGVGGGMLRWPIIDGCQRRLPGTPQGDQWLSMEMLMHID